MKNEKLKLLIKKQLSENMSITEDIFTKSLLHLKSLHQILKMQIHLKYLHLFIA